MNSPLTMLVVEDNPDHMADLKTMLVAELPRLPIRVHAIHAANLAGAIHLLPQANIVMTDVFFPAVPDGPEEPNGKKVVEECLAAGKPVVWVTSLYHHGRKANDLNNWGRERGMEMFDCEVGGHHPSHRDEEVKHKPWKIAFYDLLYTFLGIEEGAFTIREGKMVDQEGNLCSRSFLTNVVRKLGYKEPDDPIIKKMIELGFPRS